MRLPLRRQIDFLALLVNVKAELLNRGRVGFLSFPPWLDGLRAALPQARVEEWSPGAPQADHAVVGAPPQQLLDEQPAVWLDESPDGS